MAHLASVASTGTGSTTTGAINTTGATLLVAAVSYYQGGPDPPTITDNKGNVWTPLTAYATGNIGKVKLYYSIPTSVGSGHTFTSNGQFQTICVSAFNDTFLASPFDQQSGAGSTSTVTKQPGSLTPSQNNTLLISAVAFGAGSNDIEAVNGGFTETAQAGDGTSAFRGGIAYLYQAAAAAVNPTWTLSAAAEIAVTLAVFKQPSSGVKPAWYIMQSCGNFGGGI